jgi:hypothetical protein
MSKLCEFVIDSRRNGRERGASHKSVPLQTAQRQGQHACEMLPSPRRSSLKRFGLSPSIMTTSTVHLSPTRASTSLTAWQSSGTWRLLGISDVPSCLRCLVIYLDLVSNHNQSTPGMTKIKIAVLVGSNRHDSINRKLAQALAKLGGTIGLPFHRARRPAPL